MADLDEKVLVDNGPGYFVVKGDYQFTMVDIPGNFPSSSADSQTSDSQDQLFYDNTFATLTGDLMCILLGQIVPEKKEQYGLRVSADANLTPDQEKLLVDMVNNYNSKRSANELSLYLRACSGDRVVN